MGKFPTFFVLLGLATLAAALFGALHNQLSYSVGPAYFTEIKFPQFGISDGIAHRIGAALVGVQASWWMGPLVGLPAFIFGLITVPTARTYLAAGMGSVFLVFVLATFGALVGLTLGLLADNTTLLDGMLADAGPLFDEGPHRSDFVRAGMMHTASYVAGGLGLIAAFFPMRRGRQIDLHRTETSGGPVHAA